MRAHTADLSFRDPDLAHAAGARMVRAGALWALGGTVLTVLAYTVGDGSGPFVLAWGAIAFGLVDVVRGLAVWSKASYRTRA